MKLIIILFFTAVIAACSSEGAKLDSSGNSANLLAIKVVGAKSFNPNIAHGQIEKYTVTVEGEGIETPIVAEFDGTASEGVIDGVPAGGDRKITVEAINPNKSVIRAGETVGVSVGGGLTEVSVEMQSVPIFANLADGASIENTRLTFELFSDPSHKVSVEEAGISANSNEINLDATTGMGEVRPPLISQGEHEFVVRDLETNRSSKIKLKVSDGVKRTPAPFVAGAVSSEKTGGALF